MKTRAMLFLENVDDEELYQQAVKAQQDKNKGKQEEYNKCSKCQKTSFKSNDLVKVNSLVKGNQLLCLDDLGNSTIGKKIKQSNTERLLFSKESTNLNFNSWLSSMNIKGKDIPVFCFQNNFEGKKKAKEFQNSFKNLNDLKKYFGLV